MSPDDVTETETRLVQYAEDYEFSLDAVRHLFHAVADGAGDMAMFDHPEFAGPGQWMRGGLIMITDAGNRLLKNRIEALCEALSALWREQPGKVRSYHRASAHAREWGAAAASVETWWPAAFGTPEAVGDDGQLAYAYFPEHERLAIRRDGRTSVYDTGGHRITGIARSQSDGNTQILFTTPEREMPLSAFSRCDAEEQPQEVHGGPNTGRLSSPSVAEGATREAGDILDALERLAELRDRQVLTEKEFAHKKQQLLDRL